MLWIVQPLNEFMPNDQIATSAGERRKRWASKPNLHDLEFPKVMRLRRKLWACIAVFSLLLSIAIAAVWTRSLNASDDLRYSYRTRVADNRFGRTDWSLLSQYGHVVIGRSIVPPDDDWLYEYGRGPGYGWSFRVEHHQIRWKDFVAGLGHIQIWSDTYNGWKLMGWKSVEAPDWLLLLVASIPAQIVFLSIIRKGRAKRRTGFPMDLRN